MLTLHVGYLLAIIAFALAFYLDASLRNDGV